MKVMLLSLTDEQYDLLLRGEPSVVRTLANVSVRHHGGTGGSAWARRAIRADAFLRELVETVRDESNWDEWDPRAGGYAMVTVGDTGSNVG